MALLSFCVSLRSVLHRAVGMHPAHCHRHGSCRICVHFVVPLSLRYIWSSCHHKGHHSPYSLRLCRAMKWNLQCRMRIWLFLQWFKVFVFTPCSNSSPSPAVAPSPAVVPSVAGGFCWGPLEQWGREHAISEGLKCTSAQLLYNMSQYILLHPLCREKMVDLFQERGNTWILLLSTCKWD